MQAYDRKTMQGGSYAGSECRKRRHGHPCDCECMICDSVQPAVLQQSLSVDAGQHTASCNCGARLYAGSSARVFRPAAQTRAVSALTFWKRVFGRN